MRTSRYHCFGLIVGLSLAVPAIGYADPILVTPTNDAVLLANTLTAASGGVVVNSATFTGASDAAGTFTGGTGVVGIESGIVLTTGQASFVTGPNNNSEFSVANGASGDAQLDALVNPAQTFDASTLVIEFTPAGNQVQFSYVFGSEEYNEYVDSTFNDVFAFFVNGVNYALIPGTNTPVSINTVNNGNAGAGQLGAGPCTNCQFYVDNATGVRNTQLDGFTLVLSFVAPVNAGQVNTLRLSIGDTSDDILDSAVFLGGGTLQVCGGPNQPPCGDDDPDPIPEPATMALLGVGFAGMWYRQRRHTHQ